jgi:hypothetical protein
MQTFEDFPKLQFKSGCLNLDIFLTVISNSPFANGYPKYCIIVG